MGKESARGMMGRGKRGREASSHCPPRSHFFFHCFLHFLLELVGASAEERTPRK